MSDPYEYEAEVAISDFIDQIIEEYGPEIEADAIEKHRLERRKAYLQKHPDVLDVSKRCLSEAQQLAVEYPSVGYFFAWVSIEVGFKDGFVKPALAGLFHQEVVAESLAVFITDTVRGKGLLKLLNNLLNVFDNSQLSKHRRNGQNETLFKELEEIRATRNGIAHRGNKVTPSEASYAIAVASYIVHNFLPGIISDIVTQ